MTKPGRVPLGQQGHDREQCQVAHCRGDQGGTELHNHHGLRTPHPDQNPYAQGKGGGGDSGGDLLGAIRAASARSAAIGLCACLERTWVVTRGGVLCVVEHEGGGGGGGGGDRANVVRCARRRQIRSVVAPQVRFGHWRVQGLGFEFWVWGRSAKWSFPVWDF